MAASSEPITLSLIHILITHNRLEGVGPMNLEDCINYAVTGLLSLIHIYVVIGSLDAAINWGRSNSLWSLTFGTSCLSLIHI